jgi:hypothetical protein
MGLFERIACFFGLHEWDLYRDPPRGYSILHCSQCGQVSTPLGGKPTVARKPTFTEEVFLRDNFKLVKRQRRFW